MPPRASWKYGVEVCENGFIATAETQDGSQRVSVSVLGGTVFFREVAGEWPSKQETLLRMALAIKEASAKRIWQPGSVQFGSPRDSRFQLRGSPQNKWRLVALQFMFKRDTLMFWDLDLLGGPKVDLSCPRCRFHRPAKDGWAVRVRPVIGTATEPRYCAV